MRTLLVAAVVALAAPAVAQPAPTTVALLPLDAEARLEIYGQPVASEIARALVAGGLDVVVVGPKMSVPTRARLIVDGSIKAKGDAVTLAIRVRDSRDGTTLESLDETATSLSTIDRAAAQLSSRVLPIVRSQIAKLPPDQPPTVKIDPVQPTAGRTVIGVLVGVGGKQIAPLRDALAETMTLAMQARSYQVDSIDTGKLDPRIAAQTVAASGKTVRWPHGPNDTVVVSHGIGFEILDYDIYNETLQGVTVPFASARVRVRIANAEKVVFDRVVVTDTVLGDRGMQHDAVARRVAREVIAILRPHLIRVEPKWR